MYWFFLVHVLLGLPIRVLLFLHWLAWDSKSLTMLNVDKGSPKHWKSSHDSDFTLCHWHQAFQMQDKCNAAVIWKNSERLILSKIKICSFDRGLVIMFPFVSATMNQKFNRERVSTETWNSQETHLQQKIAFHRCFTLLVCHHQPHL